MGRAIGMATRGLKPVAEIQFFDYIWPAMMQIRDELATMRWRSNDDFSCPLVIRVPIGGYLNGGAIYHSQSGEVEFTHLPGLRVVLPSNALDACGLLRTAFAATIRCCSWSTRNCIASHTTARRIPGADFTIPFGKAKVVKPGRQSDDRHLRRAGAEIDAGGDAGGASAIRTPGRGDRSADARAIRLGGHPRVGGEDQPGDRGARGYALVRLRCGDRGAHRRRTVRSLDAPVGRVGALDTWVGYHPQLEAAILPQVDDLAAAMERTLAY